MASLADTLHALAGDTSYVALNAKAETATQHEVPCDGGLVRVTFIPTGAADPVRTADDTIAKLRADSGKKTKKDAT